jgi:hypothetical protein
LAYELLTIVTDLAKARLVTSLANGYAIQITHFAVGSQGHDEVSPLSAKKPDVGLNPTPGVTGDALPEDTVFGPKEVGSFSLGSNLLSTWSCVLEKGEATSAVSSYYLLAKYVYPNPAFLNGVDGDPNPSETSHALYGLYDKLWVWSYTNAPLKVKTDGERWTLLLGSRF